MTGEKDPRDVMQAEHDARLSEHSAFRAPAEMPGVEEIARAIASWRHRSTPANPYRPSILPSEMAQASAVIALFAPILAEKDAWAERGWNAFSIAHDQAMANGNAAHLAEARALAAEAALAAERERCAKIAESFECGERSDYGGGHDRAVYAIAEAIRAGVVK